MALETLKGVTEIRGEKIVDMVALKETNPEMFRPDGSMHYHLFEKNIRPFNHIYVRHDVNSLAFTLQNGPIKEVGKNGCQVVDIIATAAKMIEGLNAKYPSFYNEQTLHCLKRAIEWQDERTKDREARGVEGESKV